MGQKAVCFKGGHALIENALHLQSNLVPRAPHKPPFVNSDVCGDCDFFSSFIFHDSLVTRLVPRPSDQSKMTCFVFCIDQNNEETISG